MQANKRDNLVITVNSTAAFLLSYFFIQILFQLATISASAIFDIPTTLFHNKIMFNVNPEAWTFDSVKVIFSAGNALLTILLIFFLVIFIKAVEMNGVLKLFFMWGFIHCLTMLVGSAVIGAFNFDGFGIVMAYLYLQDTAKMIILFSGLTLIMGVAILMVRPMLFTANIYYNMIHEDKRLLFCRFQFLYPYLVSVLIIGALRFPLSLYEWLMLSMPLFFLLHIFWSNGRYPDFYFEEQPVRIRLAPFMVIITITVLVAGRIFLGKGINFG